jgi:hypothetical protein
MNGLDIAARYGFKPQQLGFCGPKGKLSNQSLFDFICSRGTTREEARKILEKFEAAFPYFKLIADNNRIKDPFDERVVKAYWIGNKFLDNVSTDALRQLIVTDFSRPKLFPRKAAEEKAKGIPEGAKPHHSFHVLMIGSVTGRIVFNERLLDLCRVSWGKVVKQLDDNSVRVKYQPLTIDKTYRLGDLQEKDIIWVKDFIPDIRPGQVVSFH